MELFIGLYITLLILALTGFGIRLLLQALWSEDCVIRARNRKRFRIALLCMAIVVLALIAAAKINTELDMRAGDTGRFATRQDRKIWLHPSNVSFEIPADWLDWYAQFKDDHNNLHLSHRELRRVRVGHGWNIESGDIVNASLAFEDCAAHVGSRSWGDEAGSYGHLQIRAYVTRLSVDEVLTRVRNQGFQTAQQVSGDAKITASREQGWERVEIDYSLLDEYYLIGVPINFYIRDIGEYRVVFVFMGSGPEGEMDSILKSIVIPANNRKS